jgi:hypothetical protein
MNKIFRKTLFIVISFLLAMTWNVSFANAKVEKNWCFDTKWGHMQGAHPLPGTKNSFDPCPGKFLKNFLLKK